MTAGGSRLIAAKRIVRDALLDDALHQTRGNRSHAAKLLRVRRTSFLRLRQYAERLEPSELLALARILMDVAERGFDDAAPEAQKETR